jgi:nitrate reductase assembly molybdenum cofactor insertion protein NarJ
MSGLNSLYLQKEFPLAGELPDHLQLILKFTPHFSSEEWNDLAKLVLLPALPKMLECLERNKNPYQQLLKVLQMILLEEVPNA